MTKKLGFGCMRLPLLDKGFTYFDTALTCHSCKREEFVREALVKRHPH